MIGKPLKHLRAIDFPIPEMSQHAQHAFEGKELTFENQLTMNDQLLYFRIKYIPTTFDDGEPGVTIIIEDVTDTEADRRKNETSGRRMGNNL